MISNEFLFVVVSSFRNRTKLVAACSYVSSSLALLRQQRALPQAPALCAFASWSPFCCCGGGGAQPVTMIIERTVTVTSPQ